MKFRKKRVLEETFAGVSPEAKASTIITETQAEVTDAILGDGIGVHDGILTTPIIATYEDEATFLLNVNQHRQLYVHIIVAAKGGLDQLGVAIEFEDKDRPGYWIRSREAQSPGTFRDQPPASREWVLAHDGTVPQDLSDGDSFIVASGVEHRNFTRARVRFRAVSGDADGDTKVLTSWYHDGGVSALLD
jgi:hypothetical protein